MSASPRADLSTLAQTRFALQRPGPARGAAAPPSHAARNAPRSAPAPGFDDLVYLPPVPPHLAGERDALARLVLASGAPVLVQLLPGEAGDRCPACARET